MSPRRNDRRAHLGYEVARLTRLGRSVRSIAAALCLNRRTVSRLLKEQRRRRHEGESAIERELPAVPCPRGSRLDAYDAEIRAWLKEYPKITAERCFEKLVDLGFSGKRTIVQERVRGIRRETVPVEPAAVMSYPPGKRAEFDWSSYQIGRKGDVKVQVWNAQLSYSRHAVLRARKDQRQPTIFVCIRASLEQWGGVPTELFTDSMPGVVDRWECDLPILNARFVDFAAHYGFAVGIAPRGEPTYKARCERKFWFVESNALNGRRFATVRALDEFFPVWTRDKVLSREHPEQPGRTVADVFAEEQLHLQPLPAEPYDTRDVVTFVVTGQGYATFQTNEYPAPGAQPGELGYVCADDNKVVVCNAKAQLLAEYERLPDGAKIRLPPAAGMRRPRVDVDQLVGQLAEWHDDAIRFACGVRDRSRQAGFQLAKLLMLQSQWKREDILAAVRRAMDFGAFQVAIVERVLLADYEPRSLPEAIAHSSIARVRQVMKDHRVPARTIDTYTCLHDGDYPRPRPAADSPNAEAGPVHTEDSDE